MSLYRGLISLVMVVLLMAGTGCGSDDRPSISTTGVSPTIAATAGTPRPGVTAPPSVASPTLPGDGTAIRGATPSPVTGSATARPAGTVTPSPSPTVGRIDGTVSPLNFGSTEPVTLKANPDPFPGNAVLTDVRIGVHPEEGGWERIVFEFRDSLPPGSIAYVSSVTGCGSGAPVPLRGGAVLVVRFTQAVAHDDGGRLTIPGIRLAGPGTTILEARETCDFEGEVTWALDLEGTRRFKVTNLTNPRRLVIDIKQ